MKRTHSSKVPRLPLASLLTSSRGPGDNSLTLAINKPIFCPVEVTGCLPQHIGCRLKQQ